MNFINAILKSNTPQSAVEPIVNATPGAAAAITLSFHELSYVGGGVECAVEKMTLHIKKVD